MTEPLSKRQLRLAVNEYVMRRKAEGGSPELIAAEVNERWPQARMTPRGAGRSGWSYSLAWDGKKKQEAKRPDGPTQCVYIHLVGGKAVACGADGYPYCPNHRNKIASAHPGSRYREQMRIF